MSAEDNCSCLYQLDDKKCKIYCITNPNSNSSTTSARFKLAVQVQTENINQNSTKF